MVSCKQCNTLNSLDSTFCKRCGTTLELTDIAEAAEKLTAMIADGNKLFADGRTEEAMMVAETAVANNPSSAAAISLKGMCHERKGQIAEALECFEKVVELNPDSTLDKIKVNDLRNTLVAHKIEAPKPDRKVAMVAAVAAMVLVVAGGAIVAKAATKPNSTDNSKLVAANNQADPGTHTFGDVMGNQQQVQPGAGQGQPNSGQVQPANGNNGNGGNNGNQNDRNDTGDTGNDPGRSHSNITLPHIPAGNRLPGTDETSNAGFGPITFTKDQVDGMTGGGHATTNTQQGKQPVDPDPGTLNQGDKQKVEPPKDDNPPGIVEINVSKPQGNPNRGGSDQGAPTANGREALVQAARSQMMAGNYQAAANTYERALRAGAETSSTYQRLGQCYERIGRTSDAITAYQRAASALEAAINAGGGDKAALQNRLDSCRQAIKVLGG